MRPRCRRGSERAHCCSLCSFSARPGLLARSFGLIKFLSLNNAEQLRAIILGFGPIDGIIKASAER